MLAGGVQDVRMTQMQRKWLSVAVCAALGGTFALYQQIWSAGLQLHADLDHAQPSLTDIVARMVAYRQWQDDNLREYKARRKFHASNPRFKMEATLEVRTIFRWPYSLESTVLRQEGSPFIREHVFEKILAAETEQASKDQADIIPKNYDFALLGKGECDGRRSWHLSMNPKRKDKYLLVGELWIDAEDYGICRVQGVPSKRVSLWISKVDIDKRLRRIEGVWLTDKIESTSDVRLGGNVRVQIEYTYDSVTVAGAKCSLHRPCLAMM
jgi:hypothetical protein